MHGMAPVYAALQDARERAHAAGARDVEEQPILEGYLGGPAKALSRFAETVKADLLVVGNLGLGMRGEKWLGSVPGRVLSKARTDLLIVHTND